jgi:hypothetical protein
MSPPEFVPFPKMPRLSREVLITEKIDGTNAQIWINDDGSEIVAGSRSRWITPAEDNFGFARWVEDNRIELLRLGPGRHFGEWWGSGIQRGYGLPKGEKRFSLFNLSRWADDEARPACCHVVPLLWRGVFDQRAVKDCLDDLEMFGSHAARGFMKPEGVVIFHVQGNFGLKKTILKDEEPKGISESA